MVFEMRAYRQTDRYINKQTSRYTDRLITILRTLTGGEIFTLAI